MAALTMRILLSFLLCVPSFTLPSSPRNDLQAVLLALDKLVHYYENNSKYLNLDGLFGLRTVEGQLQLLISEHQAGGHQHLSQDVIKKIIDLKLAAHNASNNGMESVRADDSEYFSDFSVLVSSPWTVNKPRRKLQASLRWEIPQYKAKVKVKLTEEMSDRCMTELMKNGSHGCEISEACIQIMTTRGLTGYGITHQLLWSMIGEIMPNCSVSLNKLLSQHTMANISTLQLELCTNNFYEMVAIVQVLMHGKVHESHQDLFLEQQFVCPNLGFYEFMKKDYLDQILSWQFPSGCFGERESLQPEEEDMDLASLLEGYHSSNTKLDPEISMERSGGAIKQMKISGIDKNLKHENNISRSATSYPKVRSSQHTSQSLTGVFKKDVLRVPRHVIVNKASTPKLPRPSLNEQSEHKIYPMIQKNTIESEQIRTFKHTNVPVHHNMFRDDKRIVQGEILDPAQSTVNIHDKNSNTFRLNSKLTYLSRSSFSPDNKSQKPSSNQGSIANRKYTLTNMLKTANQDIVSKLSMNQIRRHLLVEKRMEGGCLSHKTGVGSGALVMYLRYLIEPANISWTGQHELFLSDSRNLLQVAGEKQEVGAGESVVHVGEVEEEEEEEEEDDENMEQELNDSVDYNDGNDAEAGDDQGDDDYNEEQADHGGYEAGKGSNNANDIDTIVINEDTEKNFKSIPTTTTKLSLMSQKRLFLKQMMMMLLIRRKIITTMTMKERRREASSNVENHRLLVHTPQLKLAGNTLIV